MEVSLQKCFATGVEQIVQASKEEKKSTEEHSAVLVNIANDVTGHFEAQRHEFQKALQSLVVAQEEVTKLYSNLGKSFNEHMRAQGTEITLMKDQAMAGINLAVAAIREEGVASRAKDSQDRLEMYKAIGDIHKDVNTIKRVLEAFEGHPYRAGYSLTPSTSSSSTSPKWWSPALPPPLPKTCNTTPAAPASPVGTTPSEPPPRIMSLISNYHASKQASKKDIEVIDLSTTSNTPEPTKAPSLPAGTISLEISIDTRMSGCPALLNKGAAPPTLTNSQYADTNSKPLECGGAKAPKVDFQKPTQKKSTSIEMAPKAAPLKQAGKKSTFIKLAATISSSVTNRPCQPSVRRGPGLRAEVRAGLKQPGPAPAGYLVDCSPTRLV
ncbi:hypothetical protein BGX38DRAFT_814722 [Terfezia claveryi]|nr:hypothetical protein BGX38DRAFT_814722 [Terfezia claveryi]